LLYSKNSAPTALGWFGNALDFQTGLQNYLRYTYVLNPVYRAFQDNIASDANLITDLMPLGYNPRPEVPGRRGCCPNWVGALDTGDEVVRVVQAIDAIVSNGC
jgi:hypothetical protein